MRNWITDIADILSSEANNAQSKVPAINVGASHDIFQRLWIAEQVDLGQRAKRRFHTVQTGARIALETDRGKSSTESRTTNMRQIWGQEIG
jgi:hypothetical protein